MNISFLKLNSLFWILQQVIREFCIEQTEARDFVIIKYGTKLRLKTKGRSIRASCSELGKRQAFWLFSRFRLKLGFEVELFNRQSFLQGIYCMLQGKQILQSQRVHLHCRMILASDARVRIYHWVGTREFFWEDCGQLPTETL